MAKFVVLINGPMCSGKSMFAAYIKEQEKLFVDLFGKWEEKDRVVGVSFEFTPPKALSLFYKEGLSHKDQEANADIFEWSMLAGRAADQLDCKYSRGLYFLDQSMISGAETYCENSFRNGHLTHQGKELYQAVLKSSIDKLGRKEQDQWCEQLIVYLRVIDPELLSKRQKERSTIEENVSLDYLTQMIVINEEFIEHKDQIYTKYGLRAPDVLVIDASVDLNADPLYHRRVLNEVIRKLGGTLDGRIRSD